MSLHGHKNSSDQFAKVLQEQQLEQLKMLADKQGIDNKEQNNIEKIKSISQYYYYIGFVIVLIGIIIAIIIF